MNFARALLIVVGLWSASILGVGCQRAKPPADPGATAHLMQQVNERAERERKLRRTLTAGELEKAQRALGKEAVNQKSTVGAVLEQIDQCEKALDKPRGDFELQGYRDLDDVHRAMLLDLRALLLGQTTNHEDMALMRIRQRALREKARNGFKEAQDWNVDLKTGKPLDKPRK